jgi:hypothetical protein
MTRFDKSRDAAHRREREEQSTASHGDDVAKSRPGEEVREQEEKASSSTRRDNADMRGDRSPQPGSALPPQPGPLDPGHIILTPSREYPQWILEMQGFRNAAAARLKCAVLMVFGSRRVGRLES